jgi:hypothetical protein
MMDGMDLNWISVGRLNPSCSRFCLTSSEMGYFSNFIVPHFDAFEKWLRRGAKSFIGSNAGIRQGC